MYYVFPSIYLPDGHLITIRDRLNKLKCLNIIIKKHTPTHRRAVFFDMPADMPPPKYTEEMRISIIEGHLCNALGIQTVVVLKNKGNITYL